MPTATLKCVQCGERKPREEMDKINNISSICKDIDCKVTYATKKGKKAVKDNISKIYGKGGGRKKGVSQKEKEQDLKTRKSAAKEACHKYIRLRDKEKLCICCDKPLGNNFHAGHYLESGNNPRIRYDEDNISGQRLDCNFFKGGDSGMYRENLIKKIGLDRVKRLESMKGGTVKRTAQDYKDIEDYYKDKLKQLNSV